MKALKTIITPEEARNRDAVRKQQRRQKGGSANHLIYRESVEKRRALARSLRSQGLAWAEVGKVLEINAEAARKLASR